MSRFKFQRDHTFEKRKDEARRIMIKYPDRVPIIVEKSTYSKNIPSIDKIKYLVSKDLTVGQFLHIIRKRIHLTPDQALFIFLEDNTLPAVSNFLSVIYNQHKNDDDFLYISYSGESTFGN